MKGIAIAIVALMTSAASAQVRTQIDDPCNATYTGNFEIGGGPLTITFERVGYNRINVTSDFRGWVVYGDGFCDESGVRYRLQGAPPQSGRFYYDRFGLESLRGVQWVNGRPYQGFIVYPDCY